MTQDILAQETFDLLEKTGLNWIVNKLPLYSGTGLKTESFGIFRNDTEDWLGTVGNRYEVMQNHTLASTLIKASEGINISMSKGGLLSQGKRIYLQAELPEEYIGKSNVKRHITAINSHDGSTSIGFGSTNIVVCCSNTFHQAYGELQKFRHTQSAEKRIEIAIHDLRIVLQLDEQLMTKFKRMADLEAKDDIVERVIKKIFEINPNDDTDKLSTRKKNQIYNFGNAYRTSIQEQGNTVWALFNGITRYVNHIAAPKEIDKKQDYIMNGTGYNINNNSFKEIMNWIDERTEKQTVYSVSN